MIPLVVIVGEVHPQQELPCPARDLYTGKVWELRRAYAEASGAPWLIYRRHRGLTPPEAELDPYALGDDWGPGTLRHTATHAGYVLNARGVRRVELLVNKPLEVLLRWALEVHGIPCTVPLLK